MKRIHRLLYPKSRVNVWAPVAGGIIIVLTALVTLTAWPSQAYDRAATDSLAAQGRVEASTYDRWLNQEVVYIIADEERAAFQKLTTHEERDMFIRQFWDRRNPKPGSPVNEFKKEHYRRIAFANEHFAASVPGWRTDRGHMYIVYGPPDEIQTRPKGERSMAATQVWMYRHVKDIGDNVFVTFVDRTGTSDYRLAPGKGW